MGTAAITGLRRLWKPLVQTQVLYLMVKPINFLSQTSFEADVFFGMVSVVDFVLFKASCFQQP